MMSHTETRKRAIILFTRTAENDARAKSLQGVSLALRRELYRALIRQAIRISKEANCTLLIATDALSTEYAEAAHLLLQRGDTFGERLNAALEDAFALGYDELVVIGNDTPELSASILKNAFDRLDDNTFVFGESADGGVYLIGLTRKVLPLLNDMFKSCRWQTKFVQSDLRDAVQHLNQTAEWLALLADIDDTATLMQISKRVNLYTLREITARLSLSSNHAIQFSLQTLYSIALPRLRRQKAPPPSFA